MDKELTETVHQDDLCVSQTLIPGHVRPCLDTIVLAVVHLTEPGFLNTITERRNGQAAMQLFHATEKPASKLLQTSTRNADVAGPDLRRAHHRAGEYLAIEYLADIIGLEKHLVKHIQGGKTYGFQLLREEKTAIDALMRGGEPMALGISNMFPSAMFVHAKTTDDLTEHHLKGMRTVILVDSVINRGKTVVEFERHVRNLRSTIKIVVVAGVVQKESVSEGGLIQQVVRDTPVDIVALRLSDNRYVGFRSTDTGHRLFNTAQVDEGVDVREFFSSKS